jgi:lipid-binding SYLF domain-containing protein
MGAYCSVFFNLENKYMDTRSSKYRRLSMKLLVSMPLLVGSLCLTENIVMAGPSQGYGEAPNADARASMKDDMTGDLIDAKATLQKAADLYTAIVKGTQGQVPESVLTKAQCIAVIPEVMTGAMIVGGSHGVGIASCKENNTWTPPAFLKLNSLSFGAQIGGKTSDLVLFMISEKTKEALKKGKFELGSDMGVTAGTFDRNLDTSKSGVIAYTRTKGAFAGASLSGGSITGDDDNTAAFYGTDVKFASLLGGNTRTEPNALADRFTELLPK